MSKLHHVNNFRTSSKIYAAFNVFVALLPELQNGNLTEKQFRKTATSEIKAATKSTDGVAGALYTTAKREAQRQGLIGEFGRGPKNKNNAVVVSRVNVVRSKDETVVQEGATIAEALAMIDEAASAKKAKLVMVDPSAEQQSEPEKA